MSSSTSACVSSALCHHAATITWTMAKQVLATDFTPAAAARVMNRLAKLSARFIGERGFSIGVDDVTPAALLQRRKAAIISQSYVQCEVARFGVAHVLMS